MYLRTSHSSSASGQITLQEVQIYRKGNGSQVHVTDRRQVVLRSYFGLQLCSLRGGVPQIPDPADTYCCIVLAAEPRANRIPSDI